MKYLDINNIDDLNKTFCDLVGIKPIKALLIHAETQERKTYTTTKCAYRRPKGWENAKLIIFKHPVYPDLTEEYNAIKLINVQWHLFGNIGDQYVMMNNEDFQTNYLYTKIKAIQTLRVFGGSDMLDEFCRQVREIDFDYDLFEDEKE